MLRLIYRQELQVITTLNLSIKKVNTLISRPNNRARALKYNPTISLIAVFRACPLLHIDM